MQIFEHPIVVAVAAIGTLLSLALFALLPLELWRLRRRGRLRWPQVREMLGSASVTVPSLLLDGVVLAFIVALYGGAARLAPWSIPVTWWSALLAVIVVDFIYYWDHRILHSNRLLWAISHSVHHSSPQYDQTTALRVSFVDGFISPWFYLPAILVGFDPGLVAAGLVVILGYQQWLHTETIGRLPWLDGWLNTPANHRVHHGVQPQYLDRNYGAISMLWDRLFRTYAAESEPVRFGLTHPLTSSHPWAIHTFELARLWRQLRVTRRLGDRLRLLWHGPAWRADP